jgi:pimeloyl-ACP methyl ester carboxylesterase
MLTDETVPAEGARYAASLVLLPGLWSGRDAWRGFATYLAHRGWECRVLDLRGTGGFAARAAALGEYLGGLSGPVVLLGHDAGASLALAAAGEARGRVAAVVLLAPLVPGSPGVRALTLEPRALVRIALGRTVRPPGERAAALAWGDLPPSVRAAAALRLGPDDAALVRDLLRARVPLHAAPVPALLVAGDRDPLLDPAAAAAIARTLTADVHVLPDAGHAILAGPAWQRAVGVVHRWIVQRLGAPLLETYAEAMADREAEEGGGDE